MSVLSQSLSVKPYLKNLGKLFIYLLNWMFPQAFFVSFMVGPHGCCSVNNRFYYRFTAEYERFRTKRSIKELWLYEWIIRDCILIDDHTDIENHR